MLATITFTDILNGSAIPLLTLIIAAVPLIDSLRARGNADPAPRARRLVTIVMMDGTKVIANLRNLGYVVTTGISNIRDEPTNAIWAGDDVNIADVKAIAQTLVQAGVLFRSLERFCHPTPGKTIQIGADDFANDQPAYTSAQIHDLRAPLPRDCSGQESP